MLGISVRCVSYRRREGMENDFIQFNHLPENDDWKTLVIRRVQMDVY